MSLEYCEDCDKMIDLDVDLEHEHFQKKQIEEMKTLKDLRLEKITRKDWYCDDDFAMSYNTIKEEAIKWVKYLADEKRKWIIHFFNLTEEDLK